MTRFYEDMERIATCVGGTVADGVKAGKLGRDGKLVSPSAPQLKAPRAPKTERDRAMLLSDSKMMQVKAAEVKAAATPLPTRDQLKSYSATDLRRLIIGAVNAFATKNNNSIHGVLADAMYDVTWSHTKEGGDYHATLHSLLHTSDFSALKVQLKSFAEAYKKDYLALSK